MRVTIAIAACALVAISAVQISAPTAAHAKEKSKKAEKAKIVIGPAPADKGQIVFYRTGGQGFALGCQVTENDERISALGAGKYFIHNPTPGKHTYVVSSEAKDVLTMEIEPGETYFVRCKIKMGIMMGRPNIGPSDQAEFDGVSHKLKLVDADDMGPKVKK